MTEICALSLVSAGLSRLCSYTVLQLLLGGGSVLCNTTLCEQLGGAVLKLLFEPLFLYHSRL